MYSTTPGVSSGAAPPRPLFLTARTGPPPCPATARRGRPGKARKAAGQDAPPPGLGPPEGAQDGAKLGAKLGAKSGAGLWPGMKGGGR
ncbi:MAG: hypothetical protein Kow00114_26540 [Kiloniellaceae bacterium]